MDDDDREDRKVEIAWCRVSGVSVPDFGFQVSGFGFRVSGSGFRVSDVGSGVRVRGSGSGFEFRGSGFCSGVRGSGFGLRLQVSGLRFQASSFRLGHDHPESFVRIPRFRFRVRVSSSGVLGFWGSGFVRMPKESRTTRLSFQKEPP